MPPQPVFLGFHFGLYLVWSRDETSPTRGFTKRTSQWYSLQCPHQGFKQTRCKPTVKPLVQFSPRTAQLTYAKTILQINPMHWDLLQNHVTSSSQSTNADNSLKPRCSLTLYHHLMALPRYLITIPKPVPDHLLSLPLPHGSLAAAQYNLLAHHSSTCVSWILYNYRHQQDNCLDHKLVSPE